MLPEWWPGATSHSRLGRLRHDRPARAVLTPRADAGHNSQEVVVKDDPTAPPSALMASPATAIRILLIVKMRTSASYYLKLSPPGYDGPCVVTAGRLPLSAD